MSPLSGGCGRRVVAAMHAMRTQPARFPSSRPQSARSARSAPNGSSSDSPHVTLANWKFATGVAAGNGLASGGCRGCSVAPGTG